MLFLNQIMFDDFANFYDLIISFQYLKFLCFFLCFNHIISIFEIEVQETFVICAKACTLISITKLKIPEIKQI